MSSLCKFMKPKSHIIISLDMIEESQAFHVLEQCADLIDIIKINYPIVLKNGLGIIKRLKQSFRKPIFADFKVADVPFTNDKIISMAAEAGAYAIMVHGIIGPDALASAVQIGNEKDCRIVVATELTHPGGIIFTQGIANSLAKLALDTGCHAVQVPGNRPERIREVKKIVGDALKLVNCGVGAQGGIFEEVLQAGGDFPIIGRAICCADSPRDAVKNLLAKLSK